MGVIQGELLEFETSDGAVLHGFLQRPKRKAQRCIVYVHGMTGNFYRHTLTMELAAAALASGLAFCSINTRGHDILSKYTKKNERVTGGTAIERFEDCLSDIRGALAALRKLGFGQFILCGHSTGCQKIAYYQYKSQDKSVKGVALLAPSDDYNYNRMRRPQWAKDVARARALVKQGKGDVPQERFYWFSARRFLSVTDLRHVESRLFNYDGPMSEFRRIKVPVLAMFGTMEPGVKPSADYLEILGKKTGSRSFTSHLVQDADHSFTGHERKAARIVAQWVRGLRNRATMPFRSRTERPIS